MISEAWFTNSHVTMILLLISFALVHSGLAAARLWAETKIGARSYRVIFALASLSLALVLIIYFFNHRYDGLILWQVQGVPGIKATVWVISAISFIFLYPATFNLLEIAAVAKPQVHLYETGIIRITRHPQMVGQILWCIAHTLWIGSTFTLLTSCGLVAHHIFGVWHGDRRLQQRYGESFLAVKQRTSVIPFWAIWQGKQTLIWQEFLKPAYLGVAIFVAILWLGHPWLIRTTSQVSW